MNRFGPYWAQEFPQWVIFDLDGTLADIKHRLHYIEGEKKDWNSFNAACEQDDYKWKIGALATTFKEIGRSIAIFTGRDENYRAHTERWLASKKVPYDLLKMRTAKDYRSDTIVKKEMFTQHFIPSDIWLVVDDRDKVVEMWRELGLTCLQVQKGDY
jgi:FMN phosphatase YigB (HAD superfamily)